MTNPQHVPGIPGDRATDSLGGRSFAQELVQRVLGSVAGPVPCDAATDQDETLDVLDRHGMSPAIAHALHGRHRNLNVPDELALALSARRRLLAATELAWRQPLVDLVGGFSRSDIPALVFKGEALAHTIYPAAAMRPRVDVDLWVADDRFEDASALLVRMGYDAEVSASGPWSLPECAFTKPVGGTRVVVDLHRKPFSRPALALAMPFADVWGRSSPLPVLGGRCPCPADALLLAALHRLAHHDDESPRLLWLYDMHLIVSRSPGALDGAVDIARRSGVAAILGDALADTRSVFGTDVPEPLLTDLATLRAREPTARLLDELTDSQRQWFDFRSLPDWRARCDYVKELLFPPLAYVLASVPAPRHWLAPWYYLARMLNSARRSLRRG